MTSWLARLALFLLWILLFDSTDQTTFSQCVTGFSKRCVANFKQALTCLFSNNAAFRSKLEERLWRWRAWPIFALTAVLAAFKSFWVVLGSWAILLTNLLTPWSKILRGSPVDGLLTVEWCYFRLQWIMAPMVLSGTFKSCEICW